MQSLHEGQLDSHLREHFSEKQPLAGSYDLGASLAWASMVSGVGAPTQRGIGSSEVCVAPPDVNQQSRAGGNRGHLGWVVCCVACAMICVFSAMRKMTITSSRLILPNSTENRA